MMPSVLANARAFTLTCRHSCQIANTTTTLASSPVPIAECGMHSHWPLFSTTVKRLKGLRNYLPAVGTPVCDAGPHDDCSLVL